MSTARFDHIAYGVEHPVDTFPTLRSTLGLDWIQWDGNVGFWALQAAFANGFKIEVIHPVDEHLNPFMRRFVDRWGNAPHHLTFRLDGLETYLERLEHIGVEPVAVRLDTPAWREAFVHARGGIGILLQLADSDNDKHTDAPTEWTELPAGDPVRFVRLEHEVQDLTRAVAILEVIDGTVTGEGSDDDGPYLDMGWPDAGSPTGRVLRLRERCDLTDGRHRSLVVDRLPESAGHDPAEPYVDGTLGASFVVDRA